MIRIGITLDDVLRSKTQQILKIYQKYINNDIDLDKLNLESNNFQKILKFKNKKDFNTFLYEDYAFEIFGEANVMFPSLDKKFNLWHLDLMNDCNIEDEIEVILCNTMEFGSSIGFTHFFLSKIAPKVRETFFPSNSMDIWDRCDILITADNKLIENTPLNKICVKIITPCNKKIKKPNGGEYNNLLEFIEEKENLYKLINKPEKDIFNKLKDKIVKIWK